MESNPGSIKQRPRQRLREKESKGESKSKRKKHATKDTRIQGLTERPNGERSRGAGKQLSPLDTRGKGGSDKLGVWD